MYLTRAFAAPALYLGWAICCTAADILSPEAWSMKLWGFAWRYKTGLVSVWLLLGLFGLLTLMPKKAWGWVIDVWAILATGLGVWTMVDWLLEGGRPYAPFSSADELGTLAAVSCFIACMVNTPIPFLASFGALCVSESRGALIGLAAGFFAALGLVRGLLATASAAIVWLVIGGHTRLVDDDGVQQRVIEWYAAAKDIAKHPLGLGHSGWYHLSMSITPSGALIHVIDRAHSLVLDWALIGGIPGALMLLAIFALALWNVRGDRAIRGALVAYFAGMSFLYDAPVTGAVFVILCAFALVPHERRYAPAN